MILKFPETGWQLYKFNLIIANLFLVYIKYSNIPQYITGTNIVEAIGIQKLKLEEFITIDRWIFHAALVVKLQISFNTSHSKLYNLRYCAERNRRESLKSYSNLLV